MSVPVPTDNFSRLGVNLDRMSEYRDDPAWLNAMQISSEARYLLLDNQNNIFLQQQDSALCYINAGTRKQTNLDANPATLLGLFHTHLYFMLVLDDMTRCDDLECNLEARRVNLREAAAILPDEQLSLFAYAKALLHWHRQTHYCAQCGAPVRMISAGHRLQCTNHACARLHFPRTDVAVIVLVEHEGSCLLGRQATWPEGRYSTLAGFVEPGETLEDAVRREVMEETGVIIDTVRYHSSQPWPMPMSLMGAFIATATCTEIRPRDHELEDARWFTPKQISAALRQGHLRMPSSFSVSYRLIADWLYHNADLHLDTLVKTAPTPR